MKDSVYDLPDKKHSVIYADPPWSYRDTADSGKRGAIHKYAVMTDSEILNFPVSSISDADSALFLWATGPRLDFAIRVLKKWEFRYVGVAFVWIKMTANGLEHFGMGSYVRSNVEFVLLGLRGKMERDSKSVRQIIRTGPEEIVSPILEHSRKPAIVRDRIDQLYSPDKYPDRIELFARDRPWTEWGNQSKRGI